MTSVNQKITNKRSFILGWVEGVERAIFPSEITISVIIALKESASTELKSAYETERFKDDSWRFLMIY